MRGTGHGIGGLARSSHFVESRRVSFGTRNADHIGFDPCRSKIINFANSCHVIKTDVSGTVTAIYCGVYSMVPTEQIHILRATLLGARKSRVAVGATVGCQEHELVSNEVLTRTRGEVGIRLL